MVVEVSLNGVDFTVTDPNPNKFVFFNTPVVHSVYPASGPNSGGTVVTLSGSNFRKDTGNPSCALALKFKPSPVPLTSPGTVIADNRMLCTFPRVVDSQKNQIFEVR